MNELIAFLRQHLIIDFDGELGLETIREMLKNDDSRDARQLLAKVVADGGATEMMLVLADCLAEPIRKMLTDEVMRENLRMYSES